MAFSFLKNLFVSKNNSIIHNRVLLYLIFLLVLADFIFLLYENDWVSVTTMVLIGALTTTFSKNMIIVLFVAVVVTNLLKFGTNIATEPLFRPMLD